MRVVLTAAVKLPEDSDGRATPALHHATEAVQEQIP